MRFNDFIVPGSPEEAGTALRQLGSDGIAIAGGTAFHFFQGDNQKTAVDITHIGLGFIEQKDTSFIVGATTCLADIMRFKAEGWVLDQVAQRVSTQQIRNISTIGGNIARIFPWADFPVALLALDAKMLIVGETEERVKADVYFDGQPSRFFSDGRLLHTVVIPQLPAGFGFGYVKDNRVNASFSMMTIAAYVRMEVDCMLELRVAAGAAIPFPARLKHIEDLLLGQKGDESFIRETVAKGIEDVPWKGKEGMSDAYAHQLARVLVADAIVAAVQQAKGGMS